MTRRFKTKESYRKWNAWRFVHKIPHVKNEKIIIHGKPHKVKHNG